MALNMVGNEHEIAPAIAQIGDVSRLYDLARDRTPESRQILAQEVGSILEASISDRESEMVADVLVELLRQAEKDMRSALAEKLSLLDNVPLRLVLQLANDDIEVAKPILVNSPVLGGFDLMYIIKSKTVDYWRAIAERRVLADQVMDMLIDTKDFETALTIVENKNIVLTDYTMSALTDMAQSSEVLAMPLLQRDEVPNDIAQAIYKHVGEEIKQFISKSYNIDAKHLDQSVAHAVDEFATSEKLPKDCRPEKYMLEAAQTARNKGLLNIKMMIGTLRRNHMRSFVAQLSVFTDISPEIIVQILMQNNGQGLALISKAFYVNKQDFISIFMLTGKIWKRGHFIKPDDIRAAIKYYDKATPELSREIIVSRITH